MRYNLKLTPNRHTHNHRHRHTQVVSLSLGPPCVFLLPGQHKQLQPQGVILRSGDVLVLGGAARLHFHGVPKVFVEVRTLAREYVNMLICEYVGVMFDV